MSLSKLKTLLENLKTCDTWSIQLLKIKTFKKNGTNYIGREITLNPQGKLCEFVNEISDKYTNLEKGILSSYSDVIDYDGSAIGKTVYKLSVNNSLVNDEYQSLIKAVASPDTELDPLDLSPQAYLLNGKSLIDNIEYPVKLISMQRPMTNLRHKFLKDKGSFTEISKKVLSLKPAIDVAIFDNSIYLLTLSGENLFNMENLIKLFAQRK